MVVDFGSSTTDIMVFEDGVPSFNRTLDLGGNALTLQLTKQLSLPVTAAEQLKRDVGILPEAPVGTTLQTMKASPLETIIAPVLNEIRYSYSQFEKQRGRKVEKIVLTGGSSYIPNLAARLEKMLEVRVLLGNPWARISTPGILQPALEEIAPRMSVAAGLALRGIDEIK
jgi:type IV pilus assembly protein PilM